MSVATRVHPSCRFVPAVGPAADRRSFIETKLDFFQQHFSLVAYTRPREVQGAAAVDLLLRVLGAGLTLRGGKDRMGFVFLYELLTGTRGAAWPSMVGCCGTQGGVQGWGPMACRGCLPSPHTAGGKRDCKPPKIWEGPCGCPRRPLPPTSPRG